jgi:hypothetical protein
MNDNALELFKAVARRVRRITGVQLANAQEHLSKALRYQNFHEARKRLLDQRDNQVRAELESAEKFLIHQFKRAGELDGSAHRS